MTRHEEAEEEAAQSKEDDEAPQRDGPRETAAMNVPAFHLIFTLSSSQNSVIVLFIPLLIKRDSFLKMYSN